MPANSTPPSAQFTRSLRPGGGGRFFFVPLCFHLIKSFRKFHFVDSQSELAVLIRVACGMATKERLPARGGNQAKKSTGNWAEKGDEKGDESRTER